jgi:superfamily I DNA and RNA helicase
MQFLVSLATAYVKDQATQSIWKKLEEMFRNVDGICYYRHPSITSSANSVPDLTVLARGYQPITMRCFGYNLDEIDEIGNDTWIINSNKKDSPILELDDYSVGLEAKFAKKRNLRRRFKVITVIALPLISEANFNHRFGSLLDEVRGDTEVIWSNLAIDHILVPLDNPLDESEWLLSKSVFQGVALDKGLPDRSEEVKNLGQAILELEKKITLLDPEQHKAAVQIAPGPQRIRGLAGTGKTVVLAKKAAIIHNNPELRGKRILFTFNTQSLYNQAQSLISKYYQEDSGEYPDWDNYLHVRHGWGSANESRRSGVYSDLCRRYGIRALTFQQAQRLEPEVPWRACYKQFLNVNIEPFYDYILVDEAQDFPKEFFQLLFRLCIPNEQTGLRCIYWAYDELQSLSSLEIPGATDLFGLDYNNDPNVSIEGEDYAGNMEKDIVLRQSYRCPHNVLMLAHGVGLGIHAPRGCVQMLSDRASWSAIGYDVVQGNLIKDEEMIISRPQENSPNRISEEYSQLLKEPVINIQSFNERQDEIEWVAQSLRADIQIKRVPEEKIVVICLDSKKSSEYLRVLQMKLQMMGVRSIIPGILGGTSEFAESGTVTLSTVWKAKGNEAPIVYILGFDYLYQYTEEIEGRNLAFTSISRSKGWLRISGSGKQMHDIEKELNLILSDVPAFKFRFPDMEKVRRLDATETSRRRKEVKTAEQAVKSILRVDENARNTVLASLNAKDQLELLESLVASWGPESLEEILNKKLNR